MDYSSFQSNFTWTSLNAVCHLFSSLSFSACWKKKWENKNRANCVTEVRIIFPGNRAQLVSNCNYCLSRALTIDLKWCFGDTGLSFAEPLLCDSLCWVAVLLPCSPWTFPSASDKLPKQTHAARCDVQKVSPQHMTQAEALPALLMVQTLLGAKGAEAVLGRGGSQSSLCTGACAASGVTQGSSSLRALLLQQTGAQHSEASKTVHKGILLYH